MKEIATNMLDSLLNCYRENFYETQQEEINFFKVARLSEQQISNIIASFLDPEESHNQESLFLDIFLSLLESYLEKRISRNFWKVNIKREKTTDKQRKIDIVIELLYENCKRIIIAIENKLAHQEQENQVKDYILHLEELKEKNIIEDFIFIYLSPEKGTSTIDNERKTRLINEKKFLEVTYSNFILGWLQKCYQKCDDTKTKLLIEDFMIWIKENFLNNIKEEKMIQLIENWIKEGNNQKEKLLLIGNIYYNYSRILDLFEGKIRSILENIKEKVTANIQTLKYEIYHENASEYKMYYSMIFDKSWPKYNNENMAIINYSVQISFYKNLKKADFIIGLSRPTDTEDLDFKKMGIKDSIEDVLEKVVKVDPSYKRNCGEWWKKDYWLIEKTIASEDLPAKIFVNSELVAEQIYSDLENLINLTHENITNIFM